LISGSKAKRVLGNKIQQQKSGQKKAIAQTPSGNSNLYQRISTVLFVPQQGKQKA
jgi:hypothetical protein